MKKTTMLSTPIANPRRTTLKHLTDLEELTAAREAAEEEVEAPELPAPRKTANPRRTVLDKLPGA